MRILIAYEPSVGRDPFAEMIRSRLTDAEIRWREDMEAESILGMTECLLLMPHKVGCAVPEDLVANESFLRKMDRLELVVTASTGFEHIDMKYCRNKGIAVYNAAAYSTDSVAELCVAFALALSRRLTLADRSVRTGRWDADGIVPGTELAGKTVGIVGTGTIGMRVATLFAAFKCSVLGWSRTERAEFLQIGGRYVDRIEEIAERCDVISLHLPLRDSTRGIVNKRFVAAMGGHAVLINASRAGLIETAPLVDALQRKEIAGAALDVLDVEPPLAGSALLAMDNVILSPHMGFKTVESLRRLDESVVLNLERFDKGDRTGQC